MLRGDFVRMSVVEAEKFSEYPEVLLIPLHSEFSRQSSLGQINSSSIALTFVL